MPRFTTIAAIISPRASELTGAVAAAATNVTAVRLASFDGSDDSNARRAAWTEATRRRNVYTLVDFDPAQALVDAWIERLNGATHAMDAAAVLIDREGLAEYFLVADDLEGDAVHWYHGFLHSFAPRRVVPVNAHPASVIDALAHLKPSSEFPPSDVIARAALDYVPVGLSTGSTSAPADTPG